MNNFLLTANGSAANSWWIYLVLIGLIVVMLIIPMFGNRKRAKEYNEMINNIKVGDTIRTVGGVIGRITKINEKDGYKTIIVETGAKNAKTSMEFDMASIAYVLNSTNKTAEKKEETKAEEKTEEKVETVSEQTEEAKTEEKVEEKPAKKATKKLTNKKSSK